MCFLHCHPCFVHNNLFIELLEDKSSYRSSWTISGGGGGRALLGVVICPPPLAPLIPLKTCKGPSADYNSVTVLGTLEFKKKYYHSSYAIQIKYTVCTKLSVCHKSTMHHTTLCREDSLHKYLCGYPMRVCAGSFVTEIVFHVES